MTRRFQFSLRALLVVLTAAAACCAFLAWLPSGARFGIGMLSVALAIRLLPLPGEPSHYYALKWRRRGEKTSRE
jgi:hypothetical protein